MNSKIKFSIQLIISAGLLFFLLKIINVRQAAGLLSRINIWFFLLLILLITLDRIFMAYKWHLLLRIKNIEITAGSAVKSYYFATFASFFLPTTVGGDLVRVYKMRREKQNGTEIASSIIIERMLGFIASAFVAVIGVLLLISLMGIGLWKFFWLVLLILLVFAAILFLSFKLHFIERIRRKGNGKLSFLLGKLQGIYKSYREYSGHKKLLFIFFVFSCIEQLAPVVGNYIASCALGLSIPFLYFLAVIPVAQLFNRIPVSFNGIGVSECLLVYFFNLLALNKTAAFTIGITGHIGIFISVLPVMVYYWARFIWRKRYSMN